MQEELLVKGGGGILPTLSMVRPQFMNEFPNSIINIHFYIAHRPQAQTAKYMEMITLDTNSVAAVSTRGEARVPASLLSLEQTTNIVTLHMLQ